MHINTQWQLQLEIDLFLTKSLIWSTWQVQKILTEIKSRQEKPLDFGVRLKNHKVRAYWLC